MIVGYLRVSTGKQHVENQMDDITRYAAAQNWSIDKWVTEVVSGKQEVKARKLGSVLKKMKRGDTLVVTEVSRLSRSLTEIMAILGSCVKRGINIYTTKEKYQFDDSINSKVLCFAFGLVAEIERNLISMRTKEALAARKAEGKRLGRKVGFCPKMAILLENSAQIYAMLDQGLSHKVICSRFNVSRATFHKFIKQHKMTGR